MSYIIQVEHLTKKFGDLVAVDNLSFNIGKGEIFAFLGPNGAGKSTTIKMITTLLKPTSGSILLGNIDPIKDALNARNLFGIVFQDPSLDEELTAYENLVFHAHLYNLDKSYFEPKIQSLLKMVDLHNRQRDLVKTFSGGMKRRLEIIRGLLHNPQIFFLDEPTLGLDPQTRNQIWEYLLSLNHSEQITIFFTTHYMEEASKYAKKIAIIDNGQIKILDSPDAIIKAQKTNSLEEAFLNITGKNIREDAASPLDHLRQARMMWRKR